MNETKLYISKEPRIKNGDFSEYSSTNGASGWEFDCWRFPTGNQFNGSYITPVQDNANFDFAITQNVGGVVGRYELTVTIDGVFTAASGVVEIGLGNDSKQLIYNGMGQTKPSVYNVTLNVTGENPVTNDFNLFIRGISTVNNQGIAKIEMKYFGTAAFSEVDTFDDVEIPITYAVADVRDISKKDSNFSLNITLPNTSNNAQLFDCVHEISTYNSTFELLRVYPAILEIQGNRTFTGFFQLNKVVVNNNREITYEGLLYSNLIEFVNRLGNQTLRGNANAIDDLDFSDSTATLTAAEFENKLSNLPNHSWNYNVGGVHQRKGDFGITVFDKFNKYNQPFVSHISFPNKRIHPWFYHELTPFVYVKDIFDEIFERAGFDYKSQFLGNKWAAPSHGISPFDFSKMVYPYIGKNADLLTNERYCRITETGNYKIDFCENGISHQQSQITDYPQTLTKTTQTVPFYNPPYSLDDNLGVSTLTAWNYTIPADGVYKIKCNLPVKLQARFRYTNNFNPIPNSTVTVQSTSQTYSFTAKFRVRHTTNTFTNIFNETKTNENLPSSFTTDANGYADIWNGTMSGETEIYLVAGDVVEFVFSHTFPVWYVANNTATWLYLSGIYALPSSVFFELPATLNNGDECVNITQVSDFGLGNDFNPSVILNTTTKKIDFINAIIKKFNLFVEDVSGKFDAVNGIWYDSNTFRIEPRNLYYSKRTETLDWSDKVDIKTIEFQRIDEYIYKKLDFNDKFDDDYWIGWYNSSIPTQYGEKITRGELNVDEGEKTEIKTIFGQTACGKINLDDTVFECPKLYVFDDNGNVKEKQYSDRVLFVYQYDYSTRPEYSNEVLGLYRLRRTPYGTGFEYNNPQIVTAKYNTLNTFNAPFGNDDADINWDSCWWYYQNLNGTWATWNNCFNTFYSDMVNEYNHPAARLMKCKCHLSAADIRGLQLNRTIIINNVPFRINRIKEWKNGNKAVECEFIKVITAPFPKIRNNRRIIPTPAVKFPIDVGKIENTVAVHGNELDAANKTIEEMKKTIINLDLRLKKLEG